MSLWDEAKSLLMDWERAAEMRAVDEPTRRAQALEMLRRIRREPAAAPSGEPDALREMADTIKRVWDALGVETFEDAGSRYIWEIVAGYRAECVAARAYFDSKGSTSPARFAELVNDYRRLRAENEAASGARENDTARGAGDASLEGAADHPGSGNQSGPRALPAGRAAAEPPSGTMFLMASRDPATGEITAPRAAAEAPDMVAVRREDALAAMELFAQQDDGGHDVCNACGNYTNQHASGCEVPALEARLRAAAEKSTKGDAS